jgi:GalNAc-alpha-(1->4)-GalNAc-alpha-(1->3)-diNAcBac-PP-undecaprenol alpha-1,4-N-acetyl-D-galactosaminyltransferase
VKRNDPDIVLAFGELIGPIARLATLGLAARFVAFNRESPKRSLKGLGSLLNPLIYPAADCIVHQTKKARLLLQRRFPFTHAHVLPNPVEIPENVPEMQSRTRRIISVGYLGGEKNQRALLHAFARLDRKPGWRVCIVGDGPDREMLKILAVELGIADEVDFLGQRSDVEGLLADSSIFAFTSLSEGSPNALAEGLAYGCACIAFDCVAGPSDLIEHGVNGFLVPAGDNQHYAGMLQQLTDDSELRERFSKAARSSVGRYEISSVVAELEKIIRDVLKGAQRAKISARGES